MNGHYVRTDLDSTDRVIVHLVAEGMTNAEIAATMVLSENTIKKRLITIGEEFGNGARAAIVATAFRRGILR